MNKTIEAIIAQLTENTGRALCDSGGAYGRNWERNQGRNFADEPAITVDFECWRDAGYGELEMSATVSLYHWMVHNLELDERLQRMMDTLAELEPNMHWLELSETFAELLKEHAGFKNVGTYNTYNDPDSCDLSQTIQYVLLNADGRDSYDATHIILSVHGGCDVRGGYSSPRIYKLDENEYEWRDSMRVDEIWANGVEIPAEQATIEGVPARTSVGCNNWRLEGWRDIEPGDENDCKDNPFKDLWCQKLADDEPAKARDDWWIAVLDKKAYLMAPGSDALDNELHAGNMYL